MEFEIIEPPINTERRQPDRWEKGQPRSPKPDQAMQIPEEEDG